MRNLQMKQKALLPMLTLFLSPAKKWEQREVDIFPQEKFQEQGKERVGKDFKPWKHRSKILLVFYQTASNQ